PGEKNKRIPAAIYMSPEGNSKDKILYKSVYSDATLCDLELTVCISTNLEKDKETERVSRLYWKKEFGDIAQRQFWYPMNKKS
ncbi:MAG: hypothetical protein MJH10_19815, partial [Epibacterium sp.]|nr:hypothetical protein [Epibacterium sp.]NQX75728.1 hypothetical protein [Epibacterium sp.]